jgi:hypothetical protein
MSETKIRKWAAYAEIGGTIAVVISLMFVVKSIDQNTKAIEAAEMNNIYSAYREIRHLPILSNADLAQTIVKGRSREALSVVEQLQWNTFREGQLDNWSQLHALFQTNLISQEAWDDWDNSYWLQWNKNDMGTHWASVQKDYRGAFGRHINNRLQNARPE